jgi:hypothetical protein
MPSRWRGKRCASIRWCAHWVPRLSPAYPGKLRSRFDLGRAIKKEHNPFAAWALGGLVLLAWEAHARQGLSPGHAWLLGGAAAAVVLFFALAKAYKRRWLFAH